MRNTFISFHDKYFDYGESLDTSEHKITIGGYESAQIVDILATFILLQSKDLFKSTQFHGIYKDDDIAIFNRKIMTEEIDTQLSKIQKRVTQISGTSKIVFTAELWKPNADDQKTNKVDGVLSVVQTTAFQYLDIYFYWNCYGELRFKVYMKPNQQLKYLNKGSFHTHHCFTAILYGVFGRLSRLTSKIKKNIRKSMEDLYPNHTKALEEARLFFSPVLHPTKRDQRYKET